MKTAKLASLTLILLGFASSLCSASVGHPQTKSGIIDRAQQQEPSGPGSSELSGPSINGRIVSWTKDSLTLSYREKGETLQSEYSWGPGTKIDGELGIGKAVIVFYQKQNAKNIAIRIKIIEEDNEIQRPSVQPSEPEEGHGQEPPGPGGSESGGVRLAGGPEPSPPSLEVSGAYNFVRIAGVDCHGGSGSAAYNVDDPFWAVAEISGCRDTGLPSGASGHVVTYLFGPRISWRSSNKFIPYGQFLVGGAQSGGTGTASGNAFAAAIGGGLDVTVSHHFSFRVAQAEFLLTRFGGSQQNNLRLESGIILRLGSK